MALVVAASAACSTVASQPPQPQRAGAPAARRAAPITDLEFCEEVPEIYALLEYEPGPVFEGAHCNDAGITSISQLVGLKGLRRLALHGDWPGGLAALAPLRELAELRIYVSSVADLAPLRDFTRLQVLEVETDQPLDLTPLADHDALTTLRISRGVRGLATLDRLSALQDLDLGMELTAQQAAALPLLRRLAFSAQGTLSLRVIAKQTDLVSLAVYADRVTDLAVLQQLARLRSLELGVAQGTLDLAPLAALPNLEKLSVPLKAIRYPGLAAVLRRHPKLHLVLDYSPCDIPDPIDIEGAGAITRAEFNSWQRSNGRCDNDGAD